MKELFVHKKFRADSLAIIAQANVILTDLQQQGFTVTLRQLYYQFVSKGLIPNRQSEYKRLGSIIDDGRKAGLIDWDAMEDRTRNLIRSASWESPQNLLDAAASQYKENPWLVQSYWPEVWIEKDALIGVIEPVCRRMRVPYFSCRGYVSSSEVYSAGKRLGAVAARTSRRPIILHLGDHDPSGLQMTEDVSDRLAMFARSGIEVRRLALNMNQVEQYDPPPNPAKDTDARFAGYRELYGDESWELDALEPKVINDLIETELKSLIDQAAWATAMAAEKRNRASLLAVSSSWDEVVDWMDREGLISEDE